MVISVQERRKEPAVNKNVHEAIMKILACLSGSNRRMCKHCRNVDACFYLMRAVYACR